MSCSCDVSPVVFTVPPPLHECAPEGAGAAAICPHCLSVSSADSGNDDPDFNRVSDAFPGGEAGAALALTLGLLNSLAINRPKIETTLEYAEGAGADPLLAIDRLLEEPTVEPAIDLERRRPQLESLLY